MINPDAVNPQRQNPKRYNPKLSPEHSLRLSSVVECNSAKKVHADGV